MNQKLFILLLIIACALAVTAQHQRRRPQFGANQFGGKGKPPKNGGANNGGAKNGGANNGGANNGGANNGGANNGGAKNGGATATTTAAAAAESDTGKNNLFNEIAQDGQPSAQPCSLSKFPPTNGQQFKNGNSCSNTQQGEIPDTSKMVSTMVMNPPNGGTIPANKAFNVQVKTINMNLGFFDNPDTEYYKFSQQLDKQGFIMGHQHVVIQQIKDPNNPLNPNDFNFFKGLNDATNNGILSVAVPNGLPAGNYRLCTMSGAFGHQPVIMPVAQRGAQDDCVRFNVK